MNLAVFEPLSDEEREELKQMYNEGSSHQFAISNAAKSPQKKVKVSGKEEGVSVVSTGDFYTAPEINVETINKLRDDIYIAGVINKQKNLIFNGQYTIEVTDTKTKKVDEELSNNMMVMCENKYVSLWENMSWTYENLFTWGISTFNPVWGIDKELGTGEYRLLKLNRRPPETFKTKPKSPTSGSDLIYSPLLQGIVPDKNGELEFWQEPELGKDPVLIKNIFYVKNPADRGFAGNPIIIPCVSILGMLGFTWNTQMEQVNRVGAKILFMRVKNPQGAGTRNNNIGDNEYANSIIKNWGKDTAFVLRENFEIEDIKLTDDSSNLEVIGVLSDLISEYVNPASFIASRQETRLGGNDNAKLEMHDNHIKGWHSILAKQFERLLMRYFEYNQFEKGRYTLKIRIPPPAHNTREDNRKDIETLFLAQSVNENEVRRVFPHLGLTELDDTGLKELRAQFAAKQRTPQLIKNLADGNGSSESKLVEKEQPAIFVIQNQSDEEKEMLKAKHELILQQKELTTFMKEKYAK